jgi:hypothetical protein
VPTKTTRRERKSGTRNETSKYRFDAITREEATIKTKPPSGFSPRVLTIQPISAREAKQIGKPAPWFPGAKIHFPQNGSASANNHKPATVIRTNALLSGKLS